MPSLQLCRALPVIQLPCCFQQASASGQAVLQASHDGGGTERESELTLRKSWILSGTIGESDFGCDQDGAKIGWQTIKRKDRCAPAALTRLMAELGANRLFCGIVPRNGGAVCGSVELSAAEFSASLFQERDRLKAKFLHFFLHALHGGSESGCRFHGKIGSLLE
jgi:hypothetical protein